MINKHLTTKTTTIFAIILVVFTTLFESCKQKGFTPEIGQDNYVVSQKNPIKKNNKRIVSVSPQVSEILCEMGCLDRLVARTDFCVYPPQLQSVTSIGGINNANLEKIIALKPDVVITSSIFTKKMFVAVEDAGIPIISFREGKDIEQMYKVINILGQITQKQHSADSLINDCKQRLSKVKHITDSIAQSKQMQRPKVYYVVGFGASGDFSAGKDTYINQIIEMAGADNIAKISSSWSFNKEDLFANQPDYIFVRAEDSALFCKTAPYSQLKAVKNHKVFGISGLDNQTPHSIDALEFIFKTVYEL